MSAPPIPSGNLDAARTEPALRPEDWLQAQTFWLSKVSAQLADIREVTIAILIGMIVLIFLVLFGFAR